MILPNSDVSGLKSALGWWEWFGYFSTAVVGLGCIGEFVAEFTSFPKNEERRHNVAKLSLLILILGIAGELLSAARTSQLSGRIIANIEEHAADAAQKAGEANQKAGEANERAGKAEERAAELLKEMQTRRLSVEQKTDIADFLKSYAGKTVSVATYHQDAEAMILAVQIEEALRKAHILVWDRIGTFGAMGMPLYLGVTVDTNSSDKKLAAALFKALKTKGGLMPLKDTVAFGQGSTVWLPPRPTGSTKEDAFVFVGEKPIAEALTPTAERQKSKTSASH